MVLKNHPHITLPAELTLDKKSKLLVFFSYLVGIPVHKKVFGKVPLFKKVSNWGLYHPLVVITALFFQAQPESLGSSDAVVPTDNSQSATDVFTGLPKNQISP